MQRDHGYFSSLSSRPDVNESKPRILYVAENSEHLNSLNQTLGDTFDVTIAASATVALALCISREPFAIVVADTRLQDMDAIAFFDRLNDSAHRSVGILVTDVSHIDVAVEAVRNGVVSRFVCRPFSDSHLVSVLKVATERLRVESSEHERLRRTVVTSLDVLADVIAGFEPESCRRAERVAHRAGKIAAQIGEPNRWVVEASAIFYQASRLPLFPEITKQLWFCSARSSDDHREEPFEFLPSYSITALLDIPRIDEIEQILQDVRRLENAEIETIGSPMLGAQILNAVSMIDDLESHGASFDDALAEISHLTFDPGREVLNALHRIGTEVDRGKRSPELSFSGSRARSALAG